MSKQTNGQFNDSEALVYDIARYLEGEVDELTAQGSIAFIVIKRNKDGKPVTLFFGRNSGNPLKMKKTKHSLTISSQGEGKDIEINQLYSYDYETGEVRKRYLYIPYYKQTWGNYNSSYGSYDSSGNYCRPTWDREEDEEVLDRWEKEAMERAEFEDYNGYGSWSGGSAQAIIRQGNFMPRTGTQTFIARDILEDANGDFMQAAIDALVEAEEAEQEENRINDSIYSVVSSEAYDELCDYWYKMNAYKVMMTKIASEFETQALEIDSKQTILVDNEGTLLPATV